MFRFAYPKQWRINISLLLLPQTLFSLLWLNGNLQSTFHLLRWMFPLSCIALLCCSPWPHRPIIDTYSLTIYSPEFVICAWNGLLRPPTTNITLLTLSFIIIWLLTHSVLCLYSYQNVHRTDHIAEWQPLYSTTNRHHYQLRSNPRLPGNTNNK